MVVSRYWEKPYPRANSIEIPTAAEAPTSNACWGRFERVGTTPSARRSANDITETVRTVTAVTSIIGDKEIPTAINPGPKTTTPAIGR